MTEQYGGQQPPEPPTEPIMPTEPAAPTEAVAPVTPPLAGSPTFQSGPPPEASATPPVPSWSAPETQPIAGDPTGAAPTGYPAPGATGPFSGAAGGGYPPATESHVAAGGAYPPPGAPSYAPPASGGTDGVALASLITGVLGTGPVALVLGILGLRRTGPGKKEGRGFAIAGTILGGLGTLGWIIAVILLIVAAVTVDTAVTNATNAWDQSTQDTIAEYAEGCRDGDMFDCDMLWIWAEDGTEEQELAQTCNGLGDRDEYDSCYTLGYESEKATSYGDDAELDALYDSCKAGEMRDCDNLYYQSPYTSGDSEYREFGSTCGGTLSATEGSGACKYADTAADTANAADALDGADYGSDEARLAAAQAMVDAAAPPESSNNYGDNWLLDLLWDNCAAGEDSQCGTLYVLSPSGSAYRTHADTCGGRGANPGVCGP